LPSNAIQPKTKSKDGFDNQLDAKHFPFQIVDFNCTLELVLSSIALPSVPVFSDFRPNYTLLLLINEEVITQELAPVSNIKSKVSE
jgi:hypothetical protein